MEQKQFNGFKNHKNRIDMAIRDKLSTKENFLSLIKLQDEFINEYREEISLLKNSESKGIQLYSLPNTEVIQNKYETILTYEYDNLIAEYSMGENIERILLRYVNVVSLMEIAWKKENGYTLLLGMISIAIMLEVDDLIFDRLVHIVKKDNLSDFLVSYLIAYRKQNLVICTNKFYHEIPYRNVLDILNKNRINKEDAILRIKKYLTKEWYRGHSSTGWYNIHKINIYVYSGYWSFESGALVKVLGLDDSILKGQPYYPYDMVHWADGQK